MPSTFFQITKDKIKEGVNALTWPGVTAAATELCHQGIQIARDISPGTIKDTIKGQFSTVASAVGAFAVGSSLWRFMTTMTDPRVWENLNNKQRLLVMTVATLGAAGSVYSCIYFGREQNTRAVGYGFAASSLIIGGADFAANEMAKPNEEYAAIDDSPRNSLTS